MVIHEQARAQRALWTLDTMEELKAFKKGKKLVFFSHQWLAWSEPDPDCIQYKSMVAAFHELIKMKNLDLSETFVWFDYTSIPQTHRGLQKLSINSLTNYAGACDYFIIVAPGEIVHKDTGIMCDKFSYQQRSWCRAEQLAHSCRRGVENMFLANNNTLEPLTWEWIKRSLQVFNGELTCCLRGHEGMDQCDKEFLVTPALGLYCELLAQEKEGMLNKERKEIVTYFKQNQNEVFPPTVKFSTPNGSHETRELFGDILKLLGELNLATSDIKSLESEGIVHKTARKVKDAGKPHKGPLKDQSWTDRVVDVIPEFDFNKDSERPQDGYDGFVKFLSDEKENGPDQKTIEMGAPVTETAERSTSDSSREQHANGEAHSMEGGESPEGAPQSAEDKV